MHSVRKDPESVWALLSSIPATDREVWLKVGMALQCEFGDEGLPVFDSWSRSAHNYDSAALAATWRSFNGSGVTMGSLVHLAKEHGWRPVSPANKTRDTSKYAKEIWLSASYSDALIGKHRYAIKKGISWAAGAKRGRASGRLIGQRADCVIVPIRNIESDKVQGVQCINSDGQKQTFGTLRDGALLLGNSLCKHEPWYVVEGWASAVSTVFHHGKTVAVCAFGKSNLDRITQAVAAAYSPDEIIVLEEVDAK